MPIFYFIYLFILVEYFYFDWWYNLKPGVRPIRRVLSWRKLISLWKLHIIMRINMCFFFYVCPFPQYSSSWIFLVRAAGNAQPYSFRKLKETQLITCIRASPSHGNHRQELKDSICVIVFTLHTHFWKAHILSLTPFTPDLYSVAY